MRPGAPVRLRPPLAPGRIVPSHPVCRAALILFVAPHTAAAEALARLYAAARLHVNLFQPSFKLREKVRVGAKVTKRWHPPATPADRALASELLDAESVARIAELGGRADPVIALAAIRAAQADLGRRVDQRGVAAASGETPIVVDLTVGVLNAKRNGEHRAIHRRPYRRVKPMPCAPLDARPPPRRDRGVA